MCNYTSNVWNGYKDWASHAASQSNLYPSAKSWDLRQFKVFTNTESTEVFITKFLNVLLKILFLFLIYHNFFSSIFCRETKVIIF